MSLYDLGLAYLFGQFHYHFGPKFIFSVNNCPSHTIWPMGHVVCIKTLKGIFWGLFLTMKSKIKLSTHDVEFQRQERTKSNQMRQLLIPRGKVPSIFIFKSPTFVLPPPKNISKEKISYSSFSNTHKLSYFSLFPRKIYFPFPSQPLLIWKKKKFSPIFFFSTLDDLCHW